MSIRSRLTKHQRLCALGLATLNLLFPERCFVCGELIDDAGAICSSFWSRLSFVGTPSGARILDRADLIVPVPLHQRRLLRRRCNQSLLLARALTGYSGVPTVPDLLQRSRNTPCKVVCRARRDDGTFERLSRCGAATMNGSAARR